jgi:hypothetical protein
MCLIATKPAKMLSEPPLEQCDSLVYPNLQHLTVAPGFTRLISNFRVRAPHLTSLLIVIDHQFNNIDQLFTQAAIFPELFSELRSYAIRQEKLHWMQDTPTELVMQLVAPVFERGLTIQKVRLQNINASDPREYHFQGFEGKGRIGLLLFDNCSYSVPVKSDKIQYGPRKEPDHDWQPFGALVDRADNFRVWMNTGENTWYAHERGWKPQFRFFI